MCIKIRTLHLILQAYGSQPCVQSQERMTHTEFPNSHEYIVNVYYTNKDLYQYLGLRHKHIHLSIKATRTKSNQGHCVPETKNKSA